MNINLSENFANKKLLTVFSDIANFNNITTNRSDIFSDIGSDEVCFTFNHEKYVDTNGTSDVVSLYLVDSNGNVVQVLDGGIVKSLESLILTTDNRLEVTKNDLVKRIDQKPSYSDISELQRQIDVLSNKVNDLMVGTSPIPSTGPDNSPTPDIDNTTTPEPSDNQPTIDEVVWENIKLNNNTVKAGSTGNLIDKGEIKRTSDNSIIDKNSGNLRFTSGNGPKLTFRNGENCPVYDCEQETGTTTVTAWYRTNSIGTFYVTVVPNDSEPDIEPELTGLQWIDSEKNNVDIVVGNRIKHYISKGTLTTPDGTTIIPLNNSYLRFDIDVDNVYQDDMNIIIQHTDDEYYVFEFGDVAGFVNVTIWYKDLNVGEFKIRVREDDVKWQNIKDNKVSISLSDNNSIQYIKEGQISAITKVHSTIGLNGVKLIDLGDVVTPGSSTTTTDPSVEPSKEPSVDRSTIRFDSDKLVFEPSIDNPLNLDIKPDNTFQCYSYKCGSIEGTDTVNVYYKWSNIDNCNEVDKVRLGSFTVEVKKPETVRLEWINPSLERYLTSVGTSTPPIDVEFNIIDGGQTYNSKLNSSYLKSKVLFVSSNGNIASISGSSNGWQIQWGMEIGTTTIDCIYNGEKIGSLTASLKKSDNSTTTTTSNGPSSGPSVGPSTVPSTSTSSGPA